MSIKTPEAVMFEGDVLQQPTIPVINETNMKKNEQMNKAIIDRPISKIRNIVRIPFKDIWDCYLIGQNPIACMHQ